MKSVLKLILLILILFNLNSCEKQKPIIIYIPEEELKLDVSPKAVLIGYQIYITGPDSIDFGYPRIIFPDSTDMDIDSVRNDTIFAIVPYTNISGPLWVESYKIEASTDPLTIINNCAEGVCVTDWYLNYDITESQSIDGFTGAGWTYKTYGDTVYLRHYGDGPNYTIDHKLYFEYDSSMTLPKFISGSYYYFGVTSVQFEVKSAIIKIRHWDLDGIIAGKLFMTPNRYWPISDVFWVNTSKE